VKQKGPPDTGGPERCELRERAAGWSSLAKDWRSFNTPRPRRLLILLGDLSQRRSVSIGGRSGELVKVVGQLGKPPRTCCYAPLFRGRSGPRGGAEGGTVVALRAPNETEMMRDGEAVVRARGPTEGIPAPAQIDPVSQIGNFFSSGLGPPRNHAQALV
jgi:hypothetical protein